MSRYSFLVSFLLILFVVACGLPTNEIVEYDDCNSIRGFDVPRKIIVVDGTSDVAYVLDTEKGIVRVPLYNFSGFENITDSSFSVSSSDILPEPTLKTITDKVYVPYDMNKDASYSFTPIDFALLDKGTTKYLYVLTYVTTDDDDAGDYLDETYFVYRINVSDPNNIVIDDEDDFLPLDSFPSSETDEDDETYDLNNVARRIYATSRALYISGNTKHPLRVILLDTSTGKFLDEMIPDKYGDRTVIDSSSSSRETIDPGVIVGYEENSDNTSNIYMASRDTSEPGIHKYVISDISAIIDGNDSTTSYPDFSDEINEDFFPRSLHLVNGSLYGSYYKQFKVYNLSSGSQRSLKLGNKVVVSDTFVFGLSDVYVAASYNYKIEEDEYADFGYDQETLWSGIKVYRDTGSSYDKTKDVIIHGVVASIGVVENNGKYVSLAVCQDRAKIVINDVE